MATISLRDIPTDLHAWLRTSADIHGRSLNAEILHVLESARCHDAERVAREEHIRAVRDRYLLGEGTGADELARMTRADRDR